MSFLSPLTCPKDTLLRSPSKRRVIGACPWIRPAGVSVPAPLPGLSSGTGRVSSHRTVSPDGRVASPRAPRLLQARTRPAFPAPQSSPAQSVTPRSVERNYYSLSLLFLKVKHDRTGNISNQITSSGSQISPPSYLLQLQLILGSGSSDTGPSLLGLRPCSSASAEAPGPDEGPKKELQSGGHLRMLDGPFPGCFLSR